MAGKINKREVVQEIQTRSMSLASKRGTAGKTVTLKTNYFKLLSKTDWCLFQYQVDINGEDRTFVKKSLLAQHRDQLGAYLFDGCVLYTCNRLQQEPLELTSIRKEDKKPFPVKIRLVGDIAKGDHAYFQVFNILIRKSLEKLKLQLVGRNYFDPGARIDIPQYHLQLWPGYITSIRQHDGGFLMNAEISYKVMRDQTLYSILCDCYQKSRDYQKDFQNQVVGTVVLTDYNNKTYRVDDVDFSVNPSHKFERNGVKVTYASYYKDKYNIIIKEKSQPLLVSNPSARDRRAGRTDPIYLIPELCRSTGITDEMRNNVQLMMALSEHTRVSPQNRITKLLKFNDRLRQNPGIVEDFKQWNFDISNQLQIVNGRTLDAECIVFNNQKSHKVFNGDFTNAVQSNIMVSSKPLTEWVAIVPSKFIDDAKGFLEKVIKFGKQMGFSVVRPKLYQMRGDRIKDYEDELQKVTSQKMPQLIFFVVPNNQLQRYQMIKKALCLDRPCPSQIVLSRTINPKNEKKLNSVATKVATQISCKIGGIPWSVVIPQEVRGLMVVGYDVCHEKFSTNNNFGAMVCSLDQQFGRYYSAVSRHASGQELSDNFSLHLRHALNAFRGENNNRLPSRIIIYRDGVGEGQIPFVYEYEVENIKKLLGHVYGEMGKEYKMAFIIVTKRINTRLFLNDNNPPPGTVCDDTITDPLKYDFFLVSQSVRQGTVSPTMYNIISDNTGLSPNAMQILAYKFTHLYFNLTGTVKVPGPCQYAHKLALLTSQALNNIPHANLQKLLYFL